MLSDTGNRRRESGDALAVAARTLRRPCSAGGFAAQSAGTPACSVMIVVTFHSTTPRYRRWRDENELRGRVECQYAPCGL